MVTTNIKPKIKGKVYDYNVGDYFKVDGVEYVLTAITKKTLKEIAEQHYQDEGAESPDEFIDVWNSIHTNIGFVPDQTVYYLEFVLSTNGNGSEASDQKHPQHHCHECGALPAKNLSESAIGKKTYYCEPCYKNVSARRGVVL